MNTAVTTQASTSGTARWLLITAGVISLALGVIGIFLPLLPTTPFVLLSAACFARSSPSLHRKLLANKTFGPVIREWETYRSIPYRTKVFAIALMIVTFGVSIIFFVRPPWLKAALAVFGLGLSIWLYRIPSRDRPRSN